MEKYKRKEERHMKIFFRKKREITKRLQKQIPMDILIFIAVLLIGDNQTVYCGRPDNCIMEV